MNSDRLNALIKNRAKGSNDVFLHLHQMFFFEHVLMRLEKSRYRDIKDIRLEDEYGGYRINVYGEFGKLKTHFFIEVTTGDIITPRKIKYKYNSIFEDKTINIMAYTIETIIAEKFESIISKNITTRAKEFYDIYIIVNNHIDKVDKTTLVKAIKRTFEHRNTNLI